MRQPEGSLIAYMSQLVQEQGGVNLAQGVPGFEPPKQLRQTLKEMIDQPVHQYPPGDGDPLVRSWVYEHYKKEYTDLSQKQLLIVKGGTEGISLVFSYLVNQIKESFGVLSFDPAYETFQHLPRLYNIPFYTLAHDSTQEQIEAEIKKRHIKIFFLASPGNPLGQIIPEERVRMIHAALKKVGGYLIFDGVYKDIYFQEPPYLPVDLTNENCFYVGSFSKSYAITGWRIGYLIAPEREIKGIKELYSYSGLCVPSVLQHALGTYLTETKEEFPKYIRSVIASQYRISVLTLRLAGMEIPDIQGGYFIWGKLPENFSDGFKFTQRLYREEKIAVVPGIHFSLSGKRYIRINIARKDLELTEGIQGICRALTGGGCSCG